MNTELLSDRAHADTMREWRRGGAMLVAALVCCAFSVFPVNILGTLITTLEGAYGWSRAAISAAVLISAGGTVFVGPWAGYLIDRFGPRRVALIGVPMLSVGMMAVGMAGPSILSWYAGWAVFACAQAFGGYIVWTKAVVGRFDRTRGLALAIMQSGAAAAHGLLPAFAVYVMSVWNWKMIYFIFSAATLTIGWPLVWLFFYGADDVGKRSKPSTGTSAIADAPGSAAAQLASREQRAVALMAAIRTRQFWQMAVSFFIAGSAVATLYVHFMPVLIGAGFSKQAAATVAIVLGPAALVGRIGGGFLLDRFTPHHVVAAVLILPAISYGILLSHVFSLPAIYVCALSMGVILGAEADFMAFLASRYFGQNAFGALYGILLGIFAIGYGIGPVVTGRLYDVTKSYQLSFIAFGCATLAGAALIACLGPSKRPQPLRTSEQTL